MVEGNKVHHLSVVSFLRKILSGIDYGIGIKHWDWGLRIGISLISFLTKICQLLFFLQKFWSAISCNKSFETLKEYMYTIFLKVLKEWAEFW